MRRRRLAALVLLAGGCLLAGAALLDRLLPPDLTRYEDRSSVVLDAEGAMLRSTLTGDGMLRLRSSVAEVDPLYLRLLLVYEDRRFGGHPGVDPLALLRAAGQYLLHGRVVSGGSTLTMQVARLLEPGGRDLGAKLRQIARALQLERRFGKEEILDLYLTLAPFGGNIEGVRAASLAYFGREPRRLSVAEAALLVALPQNPSRNRPDRADEGARRARDKVLRRAAASGMIGAEQLAEALAEAVPAQRTTLPQLAWHASERLLAGERAGAEVKSTMARRLQAKVEALAERELPFAGADAAIAAVVVELDGRKVRAYYGGGGPGQPTGYVDLARATRSPGSTLKPFIYGLGFDAGLIHPETEILDGARRFGDFAPRNFDRDFHGRVSVRVALQQSLNVPAVAVLDRLGAGFFTASLRQAGAPLRLPREEEAASLAIALGGVGSDLVQLVMLYGALADDGLVRPLTLRADAPAGTPARLLSTDAAAKVSEILREVERPEGLAPNPQVQGIAYKTGTSYGFRDAWAIGYSRSHVVGVWVGRPDGMPRPGAYGRVAAAPLLFKIFQLLPQGRIEPQLQRAAPRARQAPPALARLDSADFQAAALVPVATEPLQILYPPDGGIVEPANREGQRQPLLLQAAGGSGALHWYVDGRPLEAARRGVALWRPDSEGFARISVVDQAGMSAGATVRVK